jgi:nanoRNase/pAp phosphatase (c-di-AMP/oligoRNAs hydrolase)
LTIILNKNRSYLVSVRAPHSNKNGADTLCFMFGGGGRKGAAGINSLPKEEKKDLLKSL